MLCRLGVWLWIAHFVKREAETLFVHKFSRSTMPLTNLFKNSWYYWSFAALVSYPLCHPLYTPPASAGIVYTGAALMVAAELVNLAVHLQLSSMRPQVCARSCVCAAVALAVQHDILVCGRRAPPPELCPVVPCSRWSPARTTQQRCCHGLASA